MAAYMEKLAEHIREHLRGIVSSSGLPDTRETHEEVARAWLEKNDIFDQKCADYGMTSAEHFAADDPRPALVMTYSGSLLALGPRKTGGGGSGSQDPAAAQSGRSDGTGAEPATGDSPDASDQGEGARNEEDAGAAEQGAGSESGAGAGPGSGPERFAAYSSIGLRQDVPTSASQSSSWLDGEVRVDEPAVFRRGPVERTSPVYRIAVPIEQLPAGEAERRLLEATTTIAEQFTEVNKTIVTG